MKAIFVALQEQNTRRWAPVARVVKDGDLYRLAYTKGAESIDFPGFGRMNDLSKEYISTDLFPLLKNRTLPQSRPEYSEYMSWLGLSTEEHDVLDELARSGGIRATDEIELIPMPQQTSNKSFEAYFFARGIRHLPKSTAARVSDLHEGDRLFIMRDVQNKQDGNALLLRTDDPISIVGYAPRYYAHDFGQLASEPRTDQVRVTVERLNPSAPASYKVLCKITAPWPEFFDACTSEFFLPISITAAAVEHALAQ